MGKAESHENIRSGKIEGQYLQLRGFSRWALRGKDPSPTDFDRLRCAGQDQRRGCEGNKVVIYLEASLLKGGWEATDALSES